MSSFISSYNALTFITSNSTTTLRPHPSKAPALRSSSMTRLVPTAFLSPPAPTSLPLTNPMSDTLRRRLKSTPLHPDTTPTPTTTTTTTTTPRLIPTPIRRPARPIKVISASALSSDDKPTKFIPRILSGVRGPILAIILHLAVATIFLAIAEGWALLDALYFSVVIATTVGYGDITPVRTPSKIFVSLYAIVSVAIIANMLQALVERFADAQNNMANSARQVVLRNAHSSTATAENAPALSDQQNTVTPVSAVPDDLLEATRLAAHDARLRFRATLIMLLGACISGAVIYGFFLQASLIDVIYFLCVSMTTVGLGDIHPVTRVGKAYAAVWLVLTSLGFANILSQYTNLKVKEKEHATAQAILSPGAGETIFEEIDGDSDGTLSESEYLGYIICKLGKVSPQEVRGIIRRFRELDIDGSGVISKMEIDSSLKKNT